MNTGNNNTRSDRRKQARYPGEVIYLIINEEPHALIDLSPQSITFEGEGYQVGDTVRLQLVSALDETDGMTAEAEVIRIEGFRIAALFCTPSDTLEHYILGYIHQHFPFGRNGI